MSRSFITFVMAVTVITLVSSDTSAGYTRTKAEVITAIGRVNPGMSRASRAAYAKTIISEARDHNIDPFTFVAIAWHESDFRPHAVSLNGEDYGLMQIRARFVRGCRGKPLDGASCRAAKARLLEGHTNIRRAAAIITKWRQLCRKRTKKPALFHRWLAGYGGITRAKRKDPRGLCGQVKRRGRWVDQARHKGVREVIACRRSLIRRQRCHRENRSGGGRSR